MAGEATIFIPGIKGTKLVETNLPTWDTIWSGVQSNFESIKDLELTAAYKGNYFEENPRSIIRPSEIEVLAYGEFLNDLKTDAPIYIFNYDWRLSAKHNGALLSEFMDYLIDKSKARSDESKKKYPKAVVPIKSFNFITHSLGNFILRNYLFHHDFQKVNKIVFSVPPFQGSLDIVTAALIGEGFFPGVKAKIRKLIRIMPGVMELLPTYAGASRYDPKAPHNFFNINYWQGNIQDSDQNDANKMKKTLSVAGKFVRNELCDLNNLSEANRNRILVIVRGGYDTWQSVIVKKNGPGDVRNYVDFEKSICTDDGDGRVPHISSCCYHDIVQTYLLEDALWFRDYSHGFVLKDERVQKLVNRFLYSETGFNPSIPSGSIKRVKGLETKVDPETGLPSWSVIT
ncbi:MAG: hypothetical protein H8E62_05130 [Planctomycetes bacterium]|nr:hypothetical protein [Planctomycetota bacterium]